MSISNPIHQYSPIDLLINSLIDWTDKTDVGKISTTADIRTHYLTDISTYRRIPLLMDTNQVVTGTAMSISNQRHQYSPIDQSINQLIYQWIEEMDGRRDTSVGQ